MTLDELDRLAAIHVMGWRRDDDEHCPSVPLYIGTNALGLTHEKCSVEDWQPTRNIAQAWECWEKILAEAEYCCADISAPYHEGFEIKMRKHMSSHEKGQYDVHVGGCDQYRSAPEAIVRACLKAKGIEV